MLCQNICQIDPDRMPGKMLIEWHLVGITGFKLSFSFCSNMIFSPFGFPPWSVSSRLWPCQFRFSFRHLNRGRKSPLKLGRNLEMLEHEHAYNEFTMWFPCVSSFLPSSWNSRDIRQFPAHPPWRSSNQEPIPDFSRILGSAIQMDSPVLVDAALTQMDPWSPKKGYENPKKALEINDRSITPSSQQIQVILGLDCSYD